MVNWDWKLHNTHHSIKYCDIFHVKEMSCIFVAIFLIRNTKWINNWYNEQHNIVLAYLKWNFWSLVLSKVLTRARIFSIRKHEVWQNIVQYLNTTKTNYCSLFDHKETTLLEANISAREFPLRMVFNWKSPRSFRGRVVARWLYRCQIYIYSPQARA